MFNLLFEILVVVALSMYIWDKLSPKTKTNLKNSYEKGQKTVKDMFKDEEDSK